MNYQRIYKQIIYRAINENRKKLKKDDINYIYYERHHIIPRCIGGNDDKENLVLLTAREHFLCHWLLVYVYPNNIKLTYAFWLMCNYKGNGIEKYKVSSRIYEISKLSHAESLKNRIVSEETRKKLSIVNTGKAHSMETREKISSSRRGKKLSIQHKESIRNSLIGKNKNKIHTPETKLKWSIAKKGKKLSPFTEDHKEKIGIANRGKKWSHETRLKHMNRYSNRTEIQCPHCFLKSKGYSNMHRYHFDNCKLINLSVDLI